MSSQRPTQAHARTPAAGKRPGSTPEEKLAELYKNMPTQELLRQGREHLANHAPEQVRRHLQLGWLIMWTLILGALVLLGAFMLWLLFMAKSSGTSFSQVRQQALSAYSSDD